MVRVVVFAGEGEGFWGSIRGGETLVESERAGVAREDGEGAGDRAGDADDEDEEDAERKLPVSGAG